MALQSLRAGSVVSGPVLPEPIEVIAVTALGDAVRLFGKGLHTGLARDIVLSAAQQSQLVVSADQPPFDGDARLFRLGIEIRAPSRLSVSALNRVLRDLGFDPISRAELAPVLAA